MIKWKWIYIGRLTPPTNKRIIGWGKSTFNGTKGTMAIGFISQENGEWILRDEERGIEGLYDVKYWHHIKAPK
jgi:hypothetical protein